MSLKILITNDDGINAEGLKYLVEHAKKYGEIVVVAPKYEQSAKSHAIEIRHNLELKKVDLFDGVDSYSFDSTPADCVRVARFGLGLNFDLVISGINKGYNMGEDIWYSGTVAACFEAKSTKSKAIAFSVCKSSNEGFKYFDEVMTYILDNNLLEYGNIYNVNMPKESKGIRITRQGGAIFNTTFTEVEKDMYFAGGSRIDCTNIDEIMFDNICVANNYISITPLTADRTDNEAYNKLIKLS